MLSIAWHTLRARKGAFAGAFFALLFASALITACGVLLETGIRGTVAPERYAGTAVVVAADQNTHWTKGNGKVKAKPLTERAWLDGSVADRLSGFKVVPEVTFPFGSGLGHGWGSAALTPFTLKAGHAPRAPDEIVGDARFKLGGKVGGYRVVGVTAQALKRQSSVFFTDEQARKLAGHPGQVTAFGVSGDKKAVEQAVGDAAKVYTGSARGPLEFRDAANARVRLISLGGAMGGTSLLVAILVVVGTFALSIQQRYRELALLRAVAATPRQVRRMIGGEALLVGTLAGVIGSAGGFFLASFVRSLFVDYKVIPANLGLALSPFPAFAGLLATLVAAWSAARLSARRTTRIRPAEALGDAAIEPGLSKVRIAFGVLFMAAYVVLLAVLGMLHSEAGAMPVAFLTVVLAAAAIALLGPLIAKVVMFVLRMPGASGHLASANLRTGSRRLGSVLTPLALAVSMACTVLFMQTTTDRTTEAQFRAGVHGPVQLLPTMTRMKSAKFVTFGVAPGAPIDPKVTAGSLAGLRPGTVAIGRNTHGKVGDTMTVTMGDGAQVPLTVVAKYDRSLGFGDMLLPRSVVAAHVDDPHRTIATRQSNAQINLVITGMIIAFTIIALVNTLAMATSSRASEFGILRLAGSTARQIRTMLHWETLATALTGIALGTLTATATLTAYATGMTGSTPSASLPTYTLIAALAALLALAATLIPARAALRS